MHHNGYTEISYVIVATPFYMDVESVLVGKSLMEGGLVTPAGYYRELAATDDITPRWICKFVSRILFCCIVYELLVGVATATAQETDSVIGSKIQTAQVMTIISWCTYSVVYLFPLLGINAAAAEASTQIRDRRYSNLRALADAAVE